MDLPWPPLSVASALLPTIRRELVADARAPQRIPGPPVDVCAIVEDGLCGYELAPHVLNLPFLIVGCTTDNIARVRRTSFDPSGEAGLRLATVQGRAVASVPRVRRTPRHAETLYADWRTAVQSAWESLEPALALQGAQWDTSMHAARSLENALVIAGLHLAQWDPAVELCGLLHQAIYGLPLHGVNGGSGTLTLKADEDTWVLVWKIGATLLRHEFSAFTPGTVDSAAQPRDVRR